MELGELSRADRLLVETIGAAGELGEKGLVYHGRTVRLTLQLLADPEGRAAVALADLKQAIPILEGLGEDRALAKAWRLESDLHLMALHTGEMEAAAAQSLEYARRAGDQARVAEAQFFLCMAAWLGPTPVPVAISNATALLDQASEDPRLEAFAAATLALMNAMRGDFDEARRLARIGRGIYEEFGWRLLLATGAAQVDGEVELLAGDPVAAERALRAGHDLLVEMGEKTVLSTVSARLADALYLQRQDEEAERFTALSEEVAASEDVAAQLGWRSTRAKLLARRGEIAAAESLAGDALALARGTDSPNIQADTLMDLAEVLRFADRGDEAAPIVDEAMNLYETKGNATSLARAGNLRDQLRSVHR